MSWNYSVWLLKNRWLVLMSGLLIAVLAASGIRHLTFSVDYHAFFSEDNPELLAYERMINTYTHSDNLIFVLSSSNENVFSTEMLSVMREITNSSWQLPHVIRVDSVSNFQHTIAIGDDLEVRPLVEENVKIQNSDIELAREVALHEPLLRDLLVDRKGKTTAIVATFELPGKSLSEIPEIAAKARLMAQDIETRYPGMRVRLAGMIMLNNAYAESSRGDIRTLVPTMLLVIFVILAVLLRSLLLTVASLMVTILSIVTAMGLAGWAGLSITTISVVAPTIIMTIVVGNCVHILVTFLHNIHGGDDRHEALRKSLNVNLTPVLMTGITTAIGFIAMNTSDVPPLNDLGNIVAMGVGAGFIYSISFFPALVNVLRVDPNPVVTRRGYAMERFAHFVIKRSKLLFWSTGVASVMLAIMIPLNETNEKFVEQFDQRLQFRQDTDFLLNNLTGVYRIQYSLDTKESGGINAPAFLNQVEEFTAWLRDLPEVRHVASMTDTYKRLNKNMHGDDPKWYRLPESRELASQFLLLYEMSLPYGLDLNNMVSLDKSETRLVVTFENLKTNYLLKLNEEIESRWKNLGSGAEISSASTTLMFSHIVDRAVSSMITGTFGVLVLISILIMLMLRSVKIGLVSLLPNLAPMCIALGLWGLFVGEVGMSISIVLAMTLGIVVDDTVHFLCKFINARRNANLETPEAVRYTFRTVGDAMLVTSGILITGFLVLSLSLFARNAEMGLLTSITIMVALLTDFLLLPPLLMKVDAPKLIKHL
ncbi:MAG: efflux RND transporter permease subunit [Candidatus Thiodiazotropha endolucinida]|uniref:Efflux RND transporter permease subunit n=1 Tax=Candidatus Thiodiazotropha taylori TaxID=2792791 RepID=A0A9E4TT34_9GAMM|nr:efflux RND transporter permease subunit [Candidatus Thiodiazotropha taylori]MCW4236473.1 efflux RND transporter permease subunit [Candidatus Thiodiazotropha endolucinida]